MDDGELMSCEAEGEKIRAAWREFFREAQEELAEVRAELIDSRISLNLSLTNERAPGRSPDALSDPYGGKS
ncbi:hypothetical protein [Micromonospora avicenniae]|nr:hypothetical protein [Micromonospora avicenniae]